jgi:transcription-repair coupling factor (superfamily II helicase)
MITLFLNDITKKINAHKNFQDLSRRFAAKQFPLTVYGPQGSFLALIIRELIKKTAVRALIVLPTETEAINLVEDLRLFNIDAGLFPWWGTIPYKEASPNSMAFGQRIKELVSLVIDPKPVIVTSLRGFLTPVPEPDSIKNLILTLKRKEKIDPQNCANILQEYGYLRVPRVSVHGEFAVRGEVLDIFMPGHEKAVRIVFEFDRIEEIKRFNPEDQASSEVIKEISLHPMKELIWTDERVRVLEEELGKFPEFKETLPLFIEEVKEKRTFPGEEMFFSLGFSSPHALTEYFTADTVFFFAERERIDTAYEALKKEYDALYRKVRHEKLVPRPEKLLLETAELRSRLRNYVDFTVLNNDSNGSVIELRNDPPRSFFGNLNFFKDELENLISSGYEIFIFADSDVQAERLKHLLKDFKLVVIPESLSGGFSFSPAKIMVIHENEIFGRRKRIPKSVKTVQSAVIDTFVELSPGDYVVHVNYGIGRFKGIQRIKSGGNERDYIHLEYAEQEFIYIPIEQVNLIQRYIGSQGNVPRLDKMGGKSWETRKNKVRKSVEDIARNLIDLYSRRKKIQGFAYPKDTEWQIEFEAAFPYEETPDQLKCIDEVKSDMEKPVPMDRLVCGDVGYGKTEIAIRASFKAIMGGKQVAILAPTTILSEQHFENIGERVRSYPIKVGMLSRFVAKKDQKKVCEDLFQGKIDLVIGTHRLLQKDVRFKDLGLIIIDEEQRFGVKDKERLKELKTSVDSLTLTATPIPRTLHMSMLKIRDMSVLMTPPSNRLPIETHILEFNEETIALAIRKEVQRGGQVYFLHNRVETLNETRLFIERLVPEILVGTAHGQMSPEDLEEIMHRFIHGGIQVLVSTTIIENGIDIPNVNTILIDRADMYGISQLYQLRGRVGRSGKLAYAYLFYPHDKALSEIAMKRLQIISDNTELGSGFKIALKDLEVRGAGNLLGREQSGDIMSVGFDMYLRLLDEAIRELDTEKEQGPPEVYLELEYTGFIPEGYINGPEEKMEVYKKIASISMDEELEGVTAELLDRFGPLPEELQSLLGIAEIRILCKKLYVSSIKERKGALEVEFSRVVKISVNRLLTLIKDSRGKVRLDPKRPYILIIETGSIGLKEKSEFIRDRLSVLI